MSSLHALKALRGTLQQRLAEYRTKTGNGIEDTNNYWSYVGRIRELTKLIEEDIPKAMKLAGDEDDA